MTSRIYKICKVHGNLTRKEVAIVGIKKVFIRCIQCRKDYNTEYRHRPHVNKLLRTKSQKFNATMVSELKDGYLKDLCVGAYNLKGRKYVTRLMITKMRKQVITRRQRLVSLI